MDNGAHALRGRDLLSVTDLSPDELHAVLAAAVALKRDGQGQILAGKEMALIFEKPSLRTRVSFTVAMHRLGGHVQYLSDAEVGLGRREPAADVARVLDRMVDVIVGRVFAQESLEELAHYARIPVINALSDAEHPCQALADLLTVYEHLGTLRGVPLAFIGDGNNVACSLMLGAAMMGMDFRIASPSGYEVPYPVLERARALAELSGARLTCVTSPDEAAEGVQALYTDVWVSMGQEREAAIRREVFAGYQVTRELMARTAPGALLLHDLPAHRGEEITEEVFEAHQATIFDQAENRLHAQQALLALTLGGEG
ncbi:MAG TPA: ornithine carbamoyltransferase [Steroidobacteraceae bacterium]|nr:ornithine carbamoyltransferase [Steroidobacteraceae bacterium]